MTDRLQQLEQRVQAQNKRITDLEAKYLALLEDLKVIRADLAKNAVTPGTSEAPVTSAYQAAFDRWPGAER